MSSPKRARTAHDKDTDYVTYYIPCASSIMKGKRTTFEDRAMLCPAFDWNTNFHGRHLFGVFDGHGGYHVAEYCKNSFTRTLKNRTEYKEGKIAEALTATFLQMDEPLWYAEDRKVLLPDERDLKKFHVIFDPTSGSFEFELEPEKKTPPKDKVKDALEDLKHGNTSNSFFLMFSDFYLFDPRPRNLKWHHCRRCLFRQAEEEADRRQRRRRRLFPLQKWQIH